MDKLYSSRSHGKYDDSGNRLSEIYKRYHQKFDLSRQTGGWNNALSAGDPCASQIFVRPGSVGGLDTSRNSRDQTR